jgi:hypothetical protein
LLARPDLSPLIICIPAIFNQILKRLVISSFSRPLKLCKDFLLDLSLTLGLGLLLRLLLGISGRLVSKEGALKAGGLKMNSLDYIDEVKCAGARV